MSIRPDEVKARIENNVALVEHIVTRMSAGLPNHYERDDLVQAGMLALVESAGRYDAERGVAFSTFVGRRIEGAILDLIRREDWLPRSVRSDARRLAAVEQDLLEDGNTSPSATELADAAGMTPHELSQLQQKVRRGVLLSLDRPVPTGDGTATLAETVDSGAEQLSTALEDQELHAYIDSAIDLLPERQRVVMIGYFREQRPMSELGAMLGVTQSRVSQIKDDALRRIREGIDAQYAESAAPASAGVRNRRQVEYAQAIAADTTHAERLRRALI